jgi:hypothetical protein
MKSPTGYKPRGVKSMQTKAATQRLGYKSNTRNPERMSHGNVKKFIPSKKQH